jgi:hypothetical protein
MKFAQTTAGRGRGQTHERQRRDRALTASMRELFPDLASLRLEFDFSDDGPFTPVPQVTVLHPAARAYFVFPCPYSHCDGEFDLAPAIKAMTRQAHTRCEGELQCGGHRGADGRPDGRCGLMLEYIVQAQRA